MSVTNGRDRSGNLSSTNTKHSHIYGPEMRTQNSIINFISKCSLGSIPAIVGLIFDSNIFKTIYNTKVRYMAIYDCVKMSAVEMAV